MVEDEEEVEEGWASFPALSGRESTAKSGLLSRAERQERNYYGSGVVATRLFQ